MSSRKQDNPLWFGYGSGIVKKDTYFDMYQDEDNLWRWRLHHKKLILAKSPEGYEKRSVCRHYIGLIKHAGAVDAPVKEG